MTAGEDGDEADEVAANASKEKAEKLFGFAKEKVKAVIDAYKELEVNLQSEFE